MKIISEGNVRLRDAPNIKTPQLEAPRQTKELNKMNSAADVTSASAPSPTTSSSNNRQTTAPQLQPIMETLKIFIHEMLMLVNQMITEFQQLCTNDFEKH